MRVTEDDLVAGISSKWNKRSYPSQDDERGGCSTTYKGLEGTCPREVVPVFTDT